MEGVSMNPGFSDHCPLSVKFDTSSQVGGKPFKFLNCLINLKSFEGTVQIGWELGKSRQTMLTVWNKLKKLKVLLKQMNKEEFTSIDSKIQNARERLESMQNQMSCPDQGEMQVELERTTKLELEKWLMVEESIMKQKSRVQWLNLGDSNTVFYHACMKNRQARNNIGRLIDSNGDIVQNPEENDNVLNRSQQLQLIRPVSRKEVKQALLGIDDNKAPGCDGYNSYFFKKVWHIVGEEITTAVQDFFESAEMWVMDRLVDNCQAAFVPGRLIIDNILMSHELVKGYGRKKIIVRWIMACISTVTYSVLINGRPTDPFEAKKGLRQGDPLSPFLFVLTIEYLSRSLKTLKEDKKFQYHPRCARFNLVQLGFADDLLLFCRGDVQSVQILYQLFQKFSAALGLVANLNKSCINFGGVNQSTQQQIKEILGYKKGEFPFRYLGVPMSTKRLSAIQCVPLIEKMLHRIQNWATKYLSYAGKAVLVKSVLFAIQIFWAQIFILPKKVIQFIEIICRRFLWTGDAEPTKNALIAWERLCSPKFVGGLNFIDVALWNEAAICKFLWNICTMK
uniref:Reverse transcriptase domain-containing protein n=1 Tax=Nicotiana tabacum TaxID=4097 RepID=A0A1S4AJ71_TOBAC|nr:PREDICTED: uncharacterized protein LOC107798203 [Nicotiana tabacum]